MSSHTFDLHQQGAHADQVFTAKFYDEHLAERDVRLPAQSCTGQEFLAATGIQDAAGVVCLKQLQQGDLVEVRLHEVIDLALPDNHRFFVMSGDRTYRFMLGESQMEWPRPSIGAATLIALARARGEVEVVQLLASGGERIVGNDEQVDLGDAGVERFRIRHIGKDVVVEYNHEPRVLPRGVYTTEQLMARFGVEPGYVLDVLRGHEFVCLLPGEQIHVHEGQKFFSHAPCGQSS
jgi:hypothetical protein